MHPLLIYTTVECTLDRFGSGKVILLVVRENHQLCKVDKSAKLGIGKTLVIHAMKLNKYSSFVVGLLHLDKDKWQTIN